MSMETVKTDKGSCLDGCLIDNHTRKLLPCFHVFCVEYLREFNRGKPPNKNACPRCQVKFVLPKRDLDSLPDNFFGRRLEQLNKISLDGKKKAEPETERKEETEMVCDICSATNGSSRGVSVAYCLDCRQYLCEMCFGCHSRMRLSRTHQVLRASTYNGRVTELFSSRDRPCEVHPPEMERVFCEVCEVPMCTKCCAEEWHRGHRFIPVSRISEEARAWIVDKLYRFEEAKIRARELLESVEVERKRFVENVEHAELEIDELKQVMLEAVSTDARNLRKALNDHKDKHIREILMLDNEVRIKCTEFEQLVGMVRKTRDLVPDSATPPVAENFNRITMQLTKPPEFRDLEESWLRSPPRTDHFLPIVNKTLNDDVDTVTGNIGELALVFKAGNSCTDQLRRDDLFDTCQGSISVEDDSMIDHF